MDKYLSDVSAFHAKFGLDSLQPGMPGPLSTDLAKIRANFMLEELMEYAHSCGLELEIQDGEATFVPASPAFLNLEGSLDALVDLTYVVTGTALFHGFGNRHSEGRTIFGEAWHRVHQANMRKMRASHASQSKRGTSFDVIKPEGWIAPKLLDLVG